MDMVSSSQGAEGRHHLQQTKSLCVWQALEIEDTEQRVDLGRKISGGFIFAFC
jgi:hypothetical protein